jgi:hypothetical protein
MDGQQAEAIEHRCVKQNDFSRIETAIAKMQDNIQSIIGEMGSWKFFKTIFISLLAIMLAAAVTAVYQFAQLQSEVANIQGQAASSNIEDKLDSIQSSLKAIESDKTNGTDD